MTRGRFLLVLRYLHFNENDNLQHTANKLYRIDILNNRFQEMLRDASIYQK